VNGIPERTSSINQEARLENHSSSVLRPNRPSIAFLFRSLHDPKGHSTETHQEAIRIFSSLVSPKESPFKFIVLRRSVYNRYQFLSQDSLLSIARQSKRVSERIDFRRRTILACRKSLVHCKRNRK
jgi:hypothetical protein